MELTKLEFASTINSSRNTYIHMYIYIFICVIYNLSWNSTWETNVVYLNVVQYIYLVQIFLQWRRTTKYDWWSFCKITPPDARISQQLFWAKKCNTTLRQAKKDKYKFRNITEVYCDTRAYLFPRLCYFTKSWSIIQFFVIDNEHLVKYSMRS